MAEPLLVVDVQRGFLNEFTHHIPERVVRLIQSNKYDPVLFTQFINTPRIAVSSPPELARVRERRRIPTSRRSSPRLPSTT